jgi:hypothetical protein
VDPSFGQSRADSNIGLEIFELHELERADCTCVGDTGLSKLSYLRCAEKESVKKSTGHERETSPMRNTSGLWRGGSTGRPAGTPNRATVEVRTFCQRLVIDTEYRANFEQRWRSGTLPPALEQMVWAYAVGKPQQSFEVISRGASLAELIAGRFPARKTMTRTTSTETSDTQRGKR